MLLKPSIARLEEIVLSFLALLMLLIYLLFIAFCRLVVWMFFIATMPMERKMRTSNGGVIGCLMGEL